VAIVSGEAFGAYVDVRPDSATKGKVVTTKLVPGTSQYLYCFDEEWVLGMKGYSVAPLDPELNIRWPIPVESTNRELISQKDAEAPTLKEALTF
jgi:dTDP-4-dehydrorhamnose 3,5-epimerase